MSTYSKTYMRTPRFNYMRSEGQEPRLLLTRGWRKAVLCLLFFSLFS